MCCLTPSRAPDSLLFAHSHFPHRFAPSLLPPSLLSAAQNPVSPLNALGSAIAIWGTWLYTEAKRIKPAPKVVEEAKEEAKEA